MSTIFDIKKVNVKVSLTNKSNKDKSIMSKKFNICPSLRDKMSKNFYF